mgnify:CR=1 FL=1
MYRDKKKKPLWIAACAILVLLLWALVKALKPKAGEKEETMQAIRDSIREQALQCYVVEGVYPPDLAYLEENYGLIINHEDYYVYYEIFADNQPPEVRVLERNR